MSIKIQVKEDYIPIQLGDEEIRFHVSDEAILRIKKGAADVQEELESIEESEDEETQLEQMKEILRRGFDFLFEEGTFEKVYSVTPSVVVCLEYFQQMTEAVVIELGKRKDINPVQDKKAKYLNKKMSLSAGSSISNSL